MDFSRGSRPAPSQNGDQHVTVSNKDNHRRRKGLDFLQIISSALFVGLTVLIVALAIFAFTSKVNPENEGKYVDTGKFQAVFLNGGQVYFGKINSVNPKYLTMSNIYYLRVNQQVQPGKQASNNDVSLVKLGCELHGPQDQMVINQSQVVFWENLKGDGQVAKAVDQFVKQNPNGLNCTQPAASPTKK